MDVWEAASQSGSGREHGGEEMRVPPADVAVEVPALDEEPGA